MEFTNNKKEYCFEAILEGGEKARLEYRWLKGKMVLMHTFVPPVLRGKGIATALVEYVLEYVKANNLKIIIYCPFVEMYVTEHPSYRELTPDA